MLIELTGSEATKVLHNLTTNQVQNLAVGTAAETFITDVRGWVVAHGIVSRIENNRWWLIGQHSEPAKVCAHLERYIIREDAIAIDRSPETHLHVHLLGQDDSSSLLPVSARRVPFTTFDPTAELLVGLDSGAADCFGAADCYGASDDARTCWDQARIPRFWPRMGIDIWDRCIPQELDRTQQAICFTKGCYLGQETIARLDSLGQIQKKLSLLRLDAASVKPGSSVYSGEKEVGNVSSSVSVDGVTWSLAVIRRGYFDAGTILTCNDSKATIQ